MEIYLKNSHSRGMFKGGFGYHGNRYDVIKCLEGNFDIPVISQSMIYFSNYTHEIFLFNYSNAYISCKKLSRASLRTRNVNLESKNKHSIFFRNGEVRDEKAG